MLMLLYGIQIIRKQFLQQLINIKLTLTSSKDSKFMEKLITLFRMEILFGMERTFWTNKKENMLVDLLLDLFIPGIKLGLKPTIQLILKLIEPQNNNPVNPKIHHHPSKQRSTNFKLN